LHPFLAKPRQIQDHPIAVESSSYLHPFCGQPISNTDTPYTSTPDKAQQTSIPLNTCNEQNGKIQEFLILLTKLINLVSGDGAILRLLEKIVEISKVDAQTFIQNLL